MDKMLNSTQVCHKVSLHHCDIRKLMKEGKFPKAIAVSTRAIAWKESDILEWIKNRDQILNQPGEEP